MDCCRTLKELEIQVGEKVLRNLKTVIKAFQLLDVNSTGLVQPQELRRLLETFCLRMTEEEYRKFSKYCNIDKDTAVDYSVFLRNLSKSNDLHLRYFMANREVSPENQQAKSFKREYLLNSAPSEESWSNYSLDDIERVFCQEFAKSIDKIEKALSARDPSGGGYVSLNYLKVVLDTFVYRLPRRIFLRLMKRFGFKTTARINWKQFLTSFYEGLEVGNIVPPLKRDRINSRNQSRKENVITKLRRHAEDSCRSLKKALLMSSAAKPNGQIIGEELRQILSSTVVKLSDSEFRELMKTLDPRGTGVVTVTSFLDLLEASPKMRKTSPCTRAKTLLPLAWDAVEEMVYDAIAKNLQAFYNMLQSYDLGDTGFIAQNDFKKVMRIFCPSLTNGHLIKTKPTAKNMTKDEVIEKLKSCIRRQDPAFRKRFLDVSKGLRGKISLHDFKKVLEDSGMPMDEMQFSLLAAKIGYKKEGMSYLDFTTGFEGSQLTARGTAGKHSCVLTLASSLLWAPCRLASGPGSLGCGREGEPGSGALSPLGSVVSTAEGAEHLQVAPSPCCGVEVQQKPSSSLDQRMPTTFQHPAPSPADHTPAGHLQPSTKTGGPAATPPQTPTSAKSHLNDHFITAEECLRLFPKRLKESFRVEGHYLGDPATALSLTLPSAGLQGPKQKVADSELACEQAHQYLVIKAKNRWADLSKNFIETDTQGNGILRRRDIKNALYGFDIPLTPREFEKLWQSYDTEGRGYITYQEFLQKLSINHSPAVHQPYAEDYFNFLGHFTKPQQVQEEIRELQQSIERAMPARDQLVDHFQDISEALSTLAESQSGSMSLRKMQQVLQECGCPLKEEELIGLLNSLGIICHDNTINYLDFLRALEKSKTTRLQPKEKEERGPINFAALNPEEVVKSIQEVVSTSQPALSQAFSALDKEDTGFVKATDFGQVLKDFCYKLTDSQYHYFLRKLRIHLTPYIHWKYFLKNFSCFLEEAADEWAKRMPRMPLPASPREVANRELLARLHKAVTSRHHTFTQEFENFDTNKMNTVSRDEFRAICTRHLQILTDEQFDRLWSEMPVNAKGRLKYLEFLSRFSAEQEATPPATGNSAQAQKGSSVPEFSEGTQSAVSSPMRDLRAGLKSRSHPCTPAGTQPLQNCELIENRLQKQVQGCWRELLKECKEKDTGRLGTITAPQFLALMEKFRLDVSKEESQQLLVKYDLRNNGTFAYCDFIQSCVLLLRAKETSLMQRMKIQNMHKMKEAGAETSSFYVALLRIQPKILHCWRPMRRMFKACDKGGTGFLSADDFRKVLRQFSINLSEEEFFHLLEYYDKTLSSKVSYNDFLRAFLQ
ncbi:EF-hand calcium-binding domain-containing protein 6 [Erethizon dorsatum]